MRSESDTCIRAPSGCRPLMRINGFCNMLQNI